MADEKKEEAGQGKGMTKADYFKKYGRDEAEISKDQMVTLDWPTPVSRYTLVYETPNESIEPIYYWCLYNLKNDLGFPVIEKITDLYAASEHSSFFGAAAQKLGLQQDKVAQFLKISHDIFKGIVLLVRDMRIIDEKLEYYTKSEAKGAEAESNEMALKGQYIDLVEGGTKNPMSVLGLASEARYTILPDLFFKLSIEPEQTDEEFFAKVAGLEYSEQFKNVLKQKLTHYYKWKRNTFRELTTRRKFTLSYIRQQYDTVMLYMHWIKPYLRTIKQLSLDMSKMDSAQMVSAFEGSMVEIEILAKKIPEGNKNVFSCALVNFSYRTKPTMGFFAEPYHKGPIHSGEVTMHLRSYAWTQKDIDNYKQMKDDESLELLSFSDKDIMEAMDSMGEDLKKYLEEAKEAKNKETKQEKPKGESMLDPFVDIAKGFGEMASAFFPSKGAANAKKQELSALDLPKTDKERKNAEDHARQRLWLHYKIFKKVHLCITW